MRTLSYQKLENALLHHKDIEKTNKIQVIACQILLNGEEYDGTFLVGFCKLPQKGICAVTYKTSSRQILVDELEITADGPFFNTLETFESEYGLNDLAESTEWIETCNLEEVEEIREKMEYDPHDSPDNYTEYHGQQIYDPYGWL